MTREEAMQNGARCNLCPIAKRPEKDNPPVPPRPPSSGKVRLVIVSDSPGRTDVQLKRSLGGAGAKFLFIELAKVGILEKDCYVTHAALCRGEGDKEDERAAECCAPRLLRELAGVSGGRPPVLPDSGAERGLSPPILLLGKSPCRSVLAVRKAGHARGFVWRIPETKVKAAPKPPKEGSKRKVRVESAKDLLARETGEARNVLVGTAVLPTLALSFILKADAWASVFRRDLARLARSVDGAPCNEEGGKPDAIGGLEVLSDLGPEVSCDIETDGINPRVCGILCVGFTDLRSGRTVVLWPFPKVDVAALGVWLGARKRIVFHNGFNFDLLVMRAKGVMW